MPTRPVVNQPSESVQFADALDFETTTSNAIWKLGSDHDWGQSIAGLADIYTRPATVPTSSDALLPLSDPLPVVVSPRPAAVAMPEQPPATPSGTPAAMPTAPRTVDATITAGPRPDQQLQPGESVGSVALAGGRNPEGQQAVYRAARAAGRSDEDARILAAVTETEGGWGGAVGDQGQATGIYQFHERGEMPGFRAWLQQQGIQGDANQLAYDPDIATRYAATTYLGRALDEGRAKGLSGAELATYVQSNGQRSVRPETTGANYERLFGAAQQQAQQPVQAAPQGQQPPPQVTTPQGVAGGPNWRETWGDNLAPDQIKETLNAGLDWDAAIATCGIAAAVAFARANGRNPSFKEALDLAQNSGEWDRSVGMKRGTTGQIALLRSMGVDATARPVNESEIAQTVNSGQPVQINAQGSGGHFYVASGYNPQTRQFYFGNSASILKASGGRQWFRLDELPALGVGTPSEAIYMGVSR